MTKNEIKARLDLQGIGYKAKAKLPDLIALYNAHCVGEGEPLLAADALPIELEQRTITLSPDAGTVVVPLQDDEPVRPEAGNCPHCGIHLSNGLLSVHDHIANSNDITYHMQGGTYEWECMGCGHQWGEVEPYEAPQVPEPTGTGLKIEKDRPEANGVKRPSIGGKCRAIWDALDAYRAEVGELPTSKVVRELAADEGWNPNNASIEYYQWRKYNGITKG